MIVTIKTWMTVIAEAFPIPPNLINLKDVLYIAIGRVSVALKGPPLVKIHIISNELKVQTRDKRLTVKITGFISGRVILKKVEKSLAPSIIAASYKVLGIAWSPERSIIIIKGSPTHASTTIVVIKAIVGSDRKVTGFSIRCNFIMMEFTNPN